MELPINRANISRPFGHLRFTSEGSATLLLSGEPIESYLEQKIYDIIEIYTLLSVSIPTLEPWGSLPRNNRELRMIQGGQIFESDRPDKKDQNWYGSLSWGSRSEYLT